MSFTLIAVLAASFALGPFARAQQTQYPKQADLPNPYRLEEGWPTLPASMNGGHWGELIRADIDPKGEHLGFSSVLQHGTCRRCHVRWSHRPANFGI